MRLMEKPSPKHSGARWSAGEPAAKVGKTDSGMVTSLVARINLLFALGGLCPAHLVGLFLRKAAADVPSVYQQLVICKS